MHGFQMFLALSLILVLTTIPLIFGGKCESKNDPDCHTTEVRKRAQAGHAQMLTTDQLTALEAKAERYWENQKRERKPPYEGKLVVINPDFTKASANYPCVAGTIPLGDAKMIDGHKYACGPHIIHGAPIVYSIGSHREQGFELALLEIRPDAKIFIFEILNDQMVPEALRDPRITYLHAGLGYDKLGWCSNNDCFSMKGIMQQYNHSYIDIVKMDIEGGEYAWLQQEATLVGPRIGQLLVEVHTSLALDAKYPGHTAFTFTKNLEKWASQRLFHSEVNVLAGDYWDCVEYSFMNAHWVGWNLVKKYEFKLWD